MRFCSHCGKPVMDKAVICVHCGCLVRQSSHHRRSACTAVLPTGYTTAATNYTMAAVRYTAADRYISVRRRDETMDVVVKVFMILGCIALGWMIIPLAWCIPMTVVTFRKIDNREPLGVGLKICTLFFVSLIAGICMLCMDD